MATSPFSAAVAAAEALPDAPGHAVIVATQEGAGRMTLLDSVLESLASLVAGADERSALVWPKARAAAFDGFEMFDTRSEGGDDLLFTDPSDAPVWPMDVRWAFRVDAAGRVGDAGWIFKRVSTLRPQQWRGRLRMVLPRMVEHHELFVPPSGRALGSCAPLAIAGKSVTIAGTRSHPAAGLGVDHSQVYEMTPREANTSNETFDVGLAHGMELRREYLWSVLLGEEGIPRARFVTDLIGVREAFRLRDVPAGRSRRAALRHWVREHWRMQRDASATDRAWVRAHLRGATEFGWGGLSCRLEPSREDARKAAKERAA